VPYAIFVDTPEGLVGTRVPSNWEELPFQYIEGKYEIILENLGVKATKEK